MLKHDMASVSLKKGKIMTKKNEIAKVSDKTVEKQQDSIFLDFSEVEDSLFIKIVGTEERLLNTTGFRMDGSARYLLLDVLITLLKAEDNLEKVQEKGNQILSAMNELNPHDGYEGMLISHMLVVYDRAMDCFRMAENKKSYSGLYSRLQNQGIKLMRLYAQQLEALDKHRRKGNQKMIVEHVHVHEGGQAIVGNVNQEGGGVKNENRK